MSDVDIFYEYIGGCSIDDISKKYGMNPDKVSDVIDKFFENYTYEA